MQTQVITKLPQPDHPLGPWLQRVKESGQASRRIRLSRFPFHVGRADTADLTIDSDRVSREHAAILCVKGQFSVQDFGSTNGTFVNGRQITEVALNDGDMIVIADIEFTFFPGRRPVLATPPLKSSTPRNRQTVHQQTSSQPNQTIWTCCEECGVCANR